MDITDMGYVIASRYNVILVSLSQQQSMTFFPLRSQPPIDSSVYRIICIGHIYGNHFDQVHSRYIALFLNLCNQMSMVELILFLHVQQIYLKDRCPLPPVALLWSSNCHPREKQWPTPYISRMQHYKSFMMFKRDYVDKNED